MVRHISFPEIEQFRSCVHNVKHHTAYKGKDAEGNAVFDYTIQNPVIRFEGTVKIHGSNSAVVRYGAETWCQSRENIISVEHDNAGFAMFAQAHKMDFESLFDAVAANVPAPSFVNPATVIYGEFCGKGIQKGMAISSLPKMFVVFNIAVCDEKNNKTWLTKAQVQQALANNTNNAIKCIYDFPHFYIDIDFNKPHEYQNQLTEMTLAVEAECPVGKQLGATGIGEGIVWKSITEGYLDSGYWFKVKGEKHSKTKVKTLALIDVEKINNIHALAEKLTPEWRLEQILQSTFNTLNGGLLDIHGMGNYIKNMMADILKEEIDTVAASGFTTKDITSPIAKRCRDYLTTKLNDLTGNV